jgi:hypothetical protein
MHCCRASFQLRRLIGIIGQGEPGVWKLTRDRGFSIRLGRVNFLSDSLKVE